MENALSVVENEDQVCRKSPIELAQSFLTSGGDLENLEKMLALQEKYDQMQAKKSFIKAMAKFKEEPVYIKKDKTNSQYHSKYSSLGSVVNACLPRMGACGLSHKWEFTQNDPKSIEGRCIVTHEDGYSDSVSMVCPVDTSGNKNPIQQIKSTRTYIKIETFASVMGLASSETDLDDDGNGAGSGKPVITESQAASIKKSLKDTGSDEQAFLAHIGADSVENIPAEKFLLAITSINKKAERNALHKTDAYRKWTEAKENCPEIAKGMKEPTTEQECIEATKEIMRRADQEAAKEAENVN